MRLKAVCEAIYFHHKDGSEVDDDDCTSDNAGDMIMAGKEEDGNDEDVVAVGENEISSVLKVHYLWKSKAIDHIICSIIV